MSVGCVIALCIHDSSEPKRASCTPATLPRQSRRLVGQSRCSGQASNLLESDRDSGEPQPQASGVSWEKEGRGGVAPGGGGILLEFSALQRKNKNKNKNKNKEVDQGVILPQWHSGSHSRVPPTNGAANGPASNR